MKTHLNECLRTAAALGLLACMTTLASAATSFSNTLTGFTGDSTVPATQTALNTAGFDFASTAGLNEEFTADPTVVFDANGASFGALWGGDGGRNYMRTIESDYATVSFVAEISVTYGAGGVLASNQQAFFGMGTGNIALFGVPDWSTLFASTFVQPENAGLTTFRTQNDANEWTGNPGATYDAGTHRLQMTFDATAKTITYAIDVDYAGGAFVADSTAAPLDLNHIDCPSGCGDPPMPISADFFGPDGWPNEPSSIYFGGDDVVAFKDFSVTISDEPGLDGDFDQDNDVDGRDFLVWQRGGSPSPLSAGDLQLWQTNYGMGGLAAITAVPEPATVLMALTAALAVWGRRAR